MPYRQDQPKSAEKILAKKQFDVEHKQFELLLKENARGRFIRITERRGDRQNAIILPDTGIETFVSALSDLSKVV